MAWQLILVLLALTGIGWWLYRNIENKATKLGSHSFEETPIKAPPTAQAPAPAPDASPASQEAPASTPGDEHP
jgi:peptidoglycan/LPS O-acetylase OafA/YrhL